MRKILALFAAITLIAALCACEKTDVVHGMTEPPATSQGASADAGGVRTEPPASSHDENPDAGGGLLTITFDYTKQSGYASNQFAVWIEDMGGNYVKTLYATRFTANGGYKNRPDSIATWVSKSGLAAMKKTEVDAITGATPNTGSLSYTWDTTDAAGNAVAPGEYKFFVEGSLRWKNSVLYSGTIDTAAGTATVQADRAYSFEAIKDQPALLPDSTESKMIAAVTASYAAD